MLFAAFSFLNMIFPLVTVTLFSPFFPPKSPFQCFFGPLLPQLKLPVMNVQTSSFLTLYALPLTGEPTMTPGSHELRLDIHSDELVVISFSLDLAIQ